MVLYLCWPVQTQRSGTYFHATQQSHRSDQVCWERCKAYDPRIHYASLVGFTIWTRRSRGDHEWFSLVRYCGSALSLNHYLIMSVNTIYFTRLCFARILSNSRHKARDVVDIDLRSAKDLRFLSILSYLLQGALQAPPIVRGCHLV